MKTAALFLSILAGSIGAAEAAAADRTTPLNIIFILTDDQRYDEIGLLNPILDTPNLDSLAREGAFFRNAFVTTALCSPSRATILTGQYMHDHGIVDNNVRFRGDARFFPMLLDEAGYQTAFIGKWHMGGEGDAPQPGFDRWVSFAGQGHYLPEQGGPDGAMLNVDGKRVPQKGYITDELTAYAIDWLGTLDRDAPFFLYLSHKALHAEFTPASRHRDQYADAKIPVPPSHANTAAFTTTSLPIGAMMPFGTIRSCSTPVGGALHAVATPGQPAGRTAGKGGAGTTADIGAGATTAGGATAPVGAMTFGA